MLDISPEDRHSIDEAVKAALWKRLGIIVAAFAVVNVFVIQALWSDLTEKAERRAAQEASAAAAKAAENYVAQRQEVFQLVTKQAVADTAAMARNYDEMQRTVGRFDESMKNLQNASESRTATQEARLRVIEGMASAVEKRYRTIDRTSALAHLQELTERTDRCEQQIAVLEKGLPAQQLKEIAQKLQAEVKTAPDAGVPQTPEDRSKQPGSVP